VFLARIKFPLQRSRSSITGLDEFDQEFYHKHYGDLYHLKSAQALRKHYILHGSSEGRFKNFYEAKSSFESRFGILPEDFDANTYVLLNPDLANIFECEWQLVLHFLEHGRREGRRYKLGENSPEDRNRSWITLFRFSDFLIHADAWLKWNPRTQEEAVGIFIEAGIDRLAPINLDHVFDPAFYRQVNGFDETTKDEALYRHWLVEGLQKSFSANEESALSCFIASRDFPTAFDWRRYRLALPWKLAESLRHRVLVLQHLFETGFEKGSSRYISGSGASQLYEAIGDFHLIRSHHRLAISAYDHALACNGSRVGATHRRGDAYAALGNTAAAYADYSRAAHMPNAPVWSTIHAARLAAVAGDYDSSFQILTEGHSTWERNIDYRRSVTELIDHFFASKSQAAMAQYKAGKRVAGDALMSQALEEVRLRISELEDFSVPMSLSPNHITILANQDLIQCRHYRVEQKQRQLRHAGINARIFDQNDIPGFVASLLGAKAAIFYRVPAFPNIIRTILTARSLGVATYYEIDDLIFNPDHYPDTFESYEGQISREEYEGLIYGVCLFRFAMSLCDYGIASTTSLSDRISPVVRNGKCFVVRNGLDERYEAVINMGRHPLQMRSPLTIFYGSGTKAHNRDFNDLVGPALLNALETYQHIRLVIVGHLNLRPEFERYSSRIKRYGFVSDLDTYWSLLAASDINLAVLAPGVMADCKSEIKWLEAAILQVPSILSATATYREILSDGVDALLVDANPDQWTRALRQLIEDHRLRVNMGAAARRKALQNYSLNAAASVLSEGLGYTLNEPAQPIDHTSRKVKVLVCNVFFPPQSYGGATRVVQDNVDYLRQTCPEFAISVFTTDEGVSTSGQFRYDKYQGLPVIRLSTPAEPNMDWRPFNAANEPLFETVLDAVRPDIIHFHCIQRLTASIVEVAAKRNIPYVITVHDGWWVSDHQFFVDQDGILRLPSSDEFDCVPPPGVAVPESIARRRRLGELLSGAAQVLAVSEAFAEIYRRAGCANVLALPNGVSPIASAPRPKAIDGRLSLGHIGGRSIHKGAQLVEAVFRTTNFEHLRLTMIDATMEPGARSERVWGNTPVVLCGPYPQDRVAELYAALDVLLAPSIWPESFGLVAREAQAQGLWVIASDRGALAESVEPGVNGFVVDVANTRGLTEVLKKLDADVVRYKSPPPPASAPLRTAADQGKELAEVYRSIDLPLRNSSSFD
jgi:glycosyltransferase involved in cell wall biosynthesis